jgi:hypothetical protein
MEIAELVSEGERSEERGARKMARRTASEATRTSAKVKVECVREGGAGPKRMEEQQTATRGEVLLIVTAARSR